jgi:methylmalonyl-CoA mutase N-terminal domain/subunit
MRDRFHATSPRAQQLRFHTQTAGSTLTAQQPDNNIVRVAIQALAAVLGGTQSLHCNGRDEALALPTEESARIALRTQQIIAEESGGANTIDPVAGSYAIETLTNRIEQDARAILDRIDRAGGTLAAIENGLIQREIQESAYRAQVAIDAGKSVVVGVNRYVETAPKKGSGVILGKGPSYEDAPETGQKGSAGTPNLAEKDPRPLFSIDPEVERRQIERVRALRAGRSAGAWRASLDAVTGAARDGTNLVPPIIAAVEAKATLGEVSDAMRAVFGEYTETASP